MTVIRIMFKGRTRRAYLTPESPGHCYVPARTWGMGEWRLYLSSVGGDCHVEQHGVTTRREAVFQACLRAGCPRARIREQLADL